MTAILAISSLLSLFEQVIEDALHGFPMRRVCFVKREHVDEDD
jgi:hypothetical protein